jgi:hypothetical protein
MGALIYLTFSAIQPMPLPISTNITPDNQSCLATTHAPNKKTTNPMKKSTLDRNLDCSAISAPHFSS